MGVGRKRISMNNWPFADAQNVATITMRQIIHGGAPILLVCHDEYDGGWQFLTGESFAEVDGMVVGLNAMFALDPTIAELVDLPLGWQASREHHGAPWSRIPI